MPDDLVAIDCGIDDRKLLHRNTHRTHKKRHITEFYAMVATRTTSRLGQLRFIDDAYPLAGELRISQTESGMETLHGDRLRAGRSPAVWVEEAAKTCLASKAGAMVTGPLSKQEIHGASGPRAVNSENAGDVGLSGGRT